MPDNVQVPKKLVEALMSFLNRRMERDRWLNDQIELRSGLEDCLDPNRLRANRHCPLCFGTGRDFDNDGNYRGHCRCERPAKEHADSFVYEE